MVFTESWIAIRGVPLESFEGCWQKKAQMLMISPLAALVPISLTDIVFGTTDLTGDESSLRKFAAAVSPADFFLAKPSAKPHCTLRTPSR